MVVPFESRDARLRRLDQIRRQECAQQFHLRFLQWQEADLSARTLCDDAARTFDGYAAQFLDSLRRMGSGESIDPTIGVRYYDGIFSVATALRDAIDDASARHEVAQTLQERVLRAELRFHNLLRTEETGQFLDHQAK